MIMYKINHRKVLRNTRSVNHIAMADVRDYAIAAMMVSDYLPSLVKNN